MRLQPVLANRTERTFSRVCTNRHIADGTFSLGVKFVRKTILFLANLTANDRPRIKGKRFAHEKTGVYMSPKARSDFILGSLLSEERYAQEVHEVLFENPGLFNSTKTKRKTNAGNSDFLFVILEKRFKLICTSMFSVLPGSY